MALMHIFKRLRSKPAAPSTPAASKQPRVVVVAPDKFKGTLTASEVADCIALEVKRQFPAMLVRSCPMADGGEGTAAILASRLNLERRSVDGHDALMRPVEIEFYLSQSGEICAVDSSAIVGLAKLSDTRLKPWKSTTYGVGEFITLMLSQGVKKLYIGIGGTASIDGGLGLLQALGGRFFDVEGEEISTYPLRAGHLPAVFSADLSGINRRALKDAVVALADVDVPLVADSPDEMSSLSFACQKGLMKSELPALCAALRSYAAAIDAVLHPCATQPPFQGAGGGLGYVISRVLRCECHSGGETILNLYGFIRNLQANNNESGPTTVPTCIITGEGCFDRQSLQGKVVGTIITKTAPRSIPVIIVAGCSTFSDADNAMLPSTAKLITTTSTQPEHFPGTIAATTNLRSTLPLIINELSSII